MRVSEDLSCEKVKKSISCKKWFSSNVCVPCVGRVLCRGAAMTGPMHRTPLASCPKIELSNRIGTHNTSFLAGSEDGLVRQTLCGHRQRVSRRNHQGPLHGPLIQEQTHVSSMRVGPHTLPARRVLMLHLAHAASTSRSKPKES